jgi:hypothetical protein
MTINDKKREKEINDKKREFFDNEYPKLTLYLCNMHAESENDRFPVNKGVE